MIDEHRSKLDCEMDGRGEIKNEKLLCPEVLQRATFLWSSI